jgi:peptidoglycan hydrolase-like protein with peptidoglycan-binding domain
MSELSGSVGEGGDNKSPDVMKVQELLNAKGFSVGQPTGSCQARTIGQIKSFQNGFMHHPDGKVDPGGKTWKKLNATGPVALDDAGPYQRTIPKPDSSSYNVGLSHLTNDMMLEIFGEPRLKRDYDDTGKDPDNPKLLRNLLSQSVGPFKARGLKPAVLSLAQVMTDVSKLQPEVYRLLHSRGMLVVRFVRPKKGKPVPPAAQRSISNHSWGCAIDIAIGTGKNALDARGDNKVQHGLNLIAPIFNQHGWFWGAGFTTEDAMHFEVGQDLLRSWLGGLA